MRLMGQGIVIEKGGRKGRDEPENTVKNAVQRLGTSFVCWVIRSKKTLREARHWELTDGNALAGGKLEKFIEAV